MPKVFLGGTVNGSKWREYVKPRLEIDYFDPVVDDWNDEAYERELHEREHSAFCLYVITPKMTGVYSIAEVIDDSNKRPEKTLFCYLLKDEEDFFTEFQAKSLAAVGKMVVRNGGQSFTDLTNLIEYLNLHKEIESDVFTG
jgi:hypothetical protein